jgi:hypothetical protein
MRALVFWWLVCCLQAACGSNQSQNNLRENLVRFNEGVRWGRLQDVMPYLYSENAEHFVETHKEFGKEIQLSDYEIINVTMMAENEKADASIQITWYRLSEMVVKTTILVQHWEKRGQDWMMIAEEIRSGEPF